MKKVKLPGHGSRGPHEPAPAMLADHPEIFAVQADEKSSHVAGEEWHSDVSCDPRPPMGSILYLTVVPPDGGGDALFANIYKAYETLSEPIQKMLAGMRAIHEGERYYR
jgi:taurine dioxygenase